MTPRRARAWRHELLDLGERGSVVGHAEPALLLDLARGAQQAPIAARANAEPTLIRRTPAAVSSSTENRAPAMPMITFTGLPTA